MWSMEECADQIKRLEKMKEAADQYLNSIEKDIKIWRHRWEAVVRSAD